jgi:hypothetical protein
VGERKNNQVYKVNSIFIALARKRNYSGRRTQAQPPPIIPGSILINATPKLLLSDLSHDAVLLRWLGRQICGSMDRKGVGVTHDKIVLVRISYHYQMLKRLKQQTFRAYWLRSKRNPYMRRRHIKSHCILPKTLKLQEDHRRQVYQTGNQLSMFQPL